MDDNSPDGTGDIADKLAEADPHVQVLHRTEKAGLGKAYIAGFGWALERGYDVIVEMDADGSHQPEYLPSLVSALNHADLSIGSRWVRGGKVVNWPKSREALSRAANIYTRVMLGLVVRGRHRGFRAYRAGTLRTISLEPGGVDRLLLPDRPDRPGRPGGAAHCRGAYHVRRTRARRLQDEQQHHSGGVLAGGSVGDSAVASVQLRKRGGTGPTADRSARG